MTKNFDPRRYRGKNRIYTQVQCGSRIARLWVWNAQRKMYETPPVGKPFLAKRYDLLTNGTRKRVSQFFDSLEEAREWQAFSHTQAVSVREVPTKNQDDSPFLSEIVEEWRKRTFPRLAIATQVAYEKLVRLYLGGLMKLPIGEITPSQIDHWLDDLRDPNGRAMQCARRLNFDHELGILSTIFKYYENYHDDPSFRSPIKNRHREAAQLNRLHVAKKKDCTEEEFFRFRNALSEGIDGKLFATLATVQYFQALRISEAAAIRWCDLIFEVIPSDSRIRISQMVCYPRKKGCPSHLKPGFKNAKANGGVKEQPLFPESYEALVRFKPELAVGLVFRRNGTHLEYRDIQYAYDLAFRKSGLPYTGTHVLRHGGCRSVFNRTGDLSIAKQHLGNSDMATVQVYAQREAGALTKHAKTRWDEFELEKNA